MLLRPHRATFLSLFTVTPVFSDSPRQNNLDEYLMISSIQKSLAGFKSISSNVIGLDSDGNPTRAIYIRFNASG
jgi:hypothetical protein